MPARPRIETAITAAHRLSALASPVLGLVLAAASETAWFTVWLPCSALAAGAERFPELPVLPELLPELPPFSVLETGCHWAYTVRLSVTSVSAVKASPVPSGLVFQPVNLKPLRVGAAVGRSKWLTVPSILSCIITWGEASVSPPFLSKTTRTPLATCHI